MKTLLIVLLALTLVNCTTYSIKKEPNGYTEVHVSSTRDLEEPRVDYIREGEDAEFHFSAASVDNNTEAFMATFQGMMGVIMEMMKANMLMAQPQ